MRREHIKFNIYMNLDAIRLYKTELTSFKNHECIHQPYLNFVSSRLLIADFLHWFYVNGHTVSFPSRGLKFLNYINCLKFFDLGPL